MLLLPCRVCQLCVLMLLPLFHTAKTRETRVILHDGKSNSYIFINVPSQRSWSDICMPRSEIEFYSCYVCQNDEMTGSGWGPMMVFSLATVLRNQVL
jgi:hypothetical protein